MKICVAQSKPVKGDIERNMESHEKLVRLAIRNGAQLIIFPELSLTGYEPSIASELATNEQDHRLDRFQKISDENEITIGVGLPTRNITGVCISTALFHPLEPRTLYSKEFLHSDENAFFVSGKRSSGLIGENKDCALAICYELSVPEHALEAFNNGAQIYIASVAKSASGIEIASERLAKIAREYSMTVLMASSIGVSGGFQGAGKSSAWNQKGELLAQLDETSEGIIVIDTLNLDTLVLQLDELQ